MIKLKMRSRGRLLSIRILLYGAPLITALVACAPRVEVAPSDKPITINLNVKSDHELRMEVEKDFDDVIAKGSGLFLDEAKTQGWVGERTDGYLGAVDASRAEIQALIVDVNRKRREAYKDIAKRNRTSLTSVEALAGDKAIQNTKPGHFIEGPGGWVKK
jgi:uncharacterized protein